MVRLCEIPRTATFAWSRGATSPQIATGTKAGAVDADFSNETLLELWDLDLSNANATAELRPVGSISADSRFHDIAWSEPNDDHSAGLIAGALESGSLDLWDAAKLGSTPDKSHVSRTSKHSGAIKSLQFNPFRHELLATAGAKGELYITDLNNVSNPSRLGTSAARADDFEAVDWNKKVPHILVTGSNGGFATVWDVKARKESLNLNNFGRKAVSAIAWDPNVPTKLATATSNDQEPLILLWDLRNSNAPERTLRLHDQGVLSLSWSQQDTRLLLSCGKDNRTICWNAQTGEALGEFPVVTNWTFQTKWSPRHPGLIATASFDGKISIQTVQNTNTDNSAAASAGPVLDGADFFAKAQSQPQGASFSLPVAPAWLERPVSATFGFGGKLVKVGLADSSSRASKISISTFVADSAVGDASQQFEHVLQGGDLTAFCESKISKAKNDEEKSAWTVIETLVSGSRKKLVEHLGFSHGEEKSNGDEKEGEESTKPNGSAADDASFFDNHESGDNFLSTLASSGGAKTNNPFHVYTGSESEADRNITEALMLGKFEDALDVCLKEDRMSDAFMIAICGGQKCIDKAQAAYFEKRSDGPNYLRLLASVVGKNLWDVVHNADLKEWKEVMATICTFADEKEFPDLCEALGDRLEESHAGIAGVTRKDASLCYLAGSKLEKVVSIWTQELQENENEALRSGGDEASFYSIHAAALQDFIEKVTIFRRVTNFIDTDRSQAGDWKLAPLYTKYAEYADVAASQGHMKIAERYLDLLPAHYPTADVAKNRVKQATRKAESTVNQRQSTAATAQRGQRVVPTYQTGQPAGATFSAVPAPSTSPYAPAGVGAQQTTYGYGPAGYQQPQQTYQPPSSGYSSTTNQPYGGGYPSFGTNPPPPRGLSDSPSVPAPSKATNLTAWNDTPDFGPKPTSRRGTPNVIPGPSVSSYVPSAPGVSPPLTASYGAQQRTASPLPPPPPKAGAARVASPATVASALGGQEQQQRPMSSAAANTYSPPPSQGPPAVPSASIPRVSSPYNLPPAGGLTSNRYAPAPGSQQAQLSSAAAPPPPRQTGPPSYASYGGQSNSPYAQQPSAAGGPPIGSFGTSQVSQPGLPPPGPPPKVAGPPRASHPAAPPPTAGARTTPLPPPQPSHSRPGSVGSHKASTASVKHPAGDRSHIPASSRPIFDILHGEMQRVKSKAPTNFRPQVLDTENRINILFDHLNNEDVVKSDTIEDLKALSRAIEDRLHDQAQTLLTDIMTAKTDEGSNWMVGVKRLIMMSKATPL